jgi:hypothetical protein
VQTLTAMESKQITFDEIKYFDNSHLKVIYYNSAENDSGEPETIIFPIKEFQRWADLNGLNIGLVEHSNADINENDIYNIQRFIYYKLNYQYISISEYAQRQINKLTVDVKKLSKENWDLKSDRAQSQVSIS